MTYDTRHCNKIVLAVSSVLRTYFVLLARGFRDSILAEKRDSTIKTHANVDKMRGDFDIARVILVLLSRMV
jgi:hypothetical protein